MNPVATATAATELVVSKGTLGVLVLLGTLVIGGLVIAVVVLWRKLIETQAKLVDKQEQHLEWVISEVDRRTDTERSLRDLAVIAAGGRNAG